MSDDNPVEVSVWKDKDCTVQIVENYFSIDICRNLRVFIDRVNEYLVEKGYIEDLDNDSLKNLECSEVSVIKSTFQINCDYSFIDKDTNEVKSISHKVDRLIISHRQD